MRALDLFCGAGGSSWGAREAGVEIIGAFDCWSMAGEVYKANFPYTEYFPGRLEDYDVSVLANRLGPIELLLASPECTNHSPAKGNKPRNEQSKETVFQVVRFAKAFKPRWIIIENVINMKNWFRYKEFVFSLESFGYCIREQVLDATNFGVPQSRRRLFLLADREKKPSIITPGKLKLKKAADIVDLNGIYRWAPLFHPKRAVATLKRAERAFIALGKKKPFLLVYYGSDGGGGWQRLERPLRTITTVDRFAIIKPDRKFGHVMRMLQVPELLAGMGMSSHMKIMAGTRRDQIKMIGNAVCPPVMKRVVHLLTNGV